jgi:hypothetical protein
MNDENVQTAVSEYRHDDRQTAGTEVGGADALLHT